MLWFDYLVTQFSAALSQWQSTLNNLHLRCLRCIVILWALRCSVLFPLLFKSLAASFTLLFNDATNELEFHFEYCSSNSVYVCMQPMWKLVWTMTQWFVISLFRSVHRSVHSVNFSSSITWYASSAIVFSASLNHLEPFNDKWVCHFFSCDNGHFTKVKY